MKLRCYIARLSQETWSTKRISFTGLQRFSVPFGLISPRHCQYNHREIVVHYSFIPVPLQGLPQGVPRHISLVLCISPTISGGYSHINWMKPKVRFRSTFLFNPWQGTDKWYIFKLPLTWIDQKFDLGLWDL